MTSGVRVKSGNLPEDLTSFVGRRHELSEVKSALSESRLVTLTGVGGVGKTRLALRAAHAGRRAFGDGVWLVELGEVHDQGLLADTVATVLGLREMTGRPALDVLIDHCADRALLLVLDNCEHLVTAVAVLAEALLRACAGVRILATSRESLDVRGEVDLRVQPLAVPHPDRPATPDCAAHYASVALFAERASAALPGFTVTAENADAVARICRRLDGLPLPIELAAARLRSMSADQILDRLIDRCRLLTTGYRGVPPRLRTLRMSIDWSYDLCTDRERELWARLSVFSGGFELDAAEGVCAVGLPPDHVLDAVASLVDKSILIREDHTEVVRYRMLETLRDYGLEKLGDGDEFDDLSRRHREWYEQLVLRSRAEWIGPRQVQWVRRLDRERANVRNALEDALADPRDPEAALRIAEAMHLYWLIRGHLGEGRRSLERALAAPGGRPSATRVAALHAAAVLAVMQNDTAAGTALAAEARTAAAAVGDTESTAVAATAGGYVAIFSGDVPRAVLAFEAAIPVFDATRAPARRVASLLGLALATGWRGDIGRAVACHEEILAITAAHRESVFRSYSLCLLALATWHQGDHVRATRLLEEGLQLTRLVEDPLTCAACLEALAWSAAERQDYDRAAVLMGAAAAVGHAAGIKRMVIPGLAGYQRRRHRQTRDALGDDTYAAAKARGHDLDLGDAVAYALHQISAPRAGSPTPALTKRELQVAELVAQGLTNRDIAQRLVISQRTAEGHVERILAKLDVPTRAQVATWFTARSAESA